MNLALYSYIFLFSFIDLSFYYLLFFFFFSPYFSLPYPDGQTPFVSSATLVSLLIASFSIPIPAPLRSPAKPPLHSPNPATPAATLEKHHELLRSKSGVQGAARFFSVDC
jgi:hypothetical protein